jgi:serine protease Do
VKFLLVAGLLLLAVHPARAQTESPATNRDWLSKLQSAWTPQRPHPSVVRVIVPEHDGISLGSGTLVDVNETQGLVVTNWHVVQGASKEITVVFPDGFRSPGQVLKVDRDWDLAAVLIQKPKVQPVPLAAEAPRQGELLTIAGYGSGTYRAATGRCTQYVAPGSNFPFEMVELAAAARQGDSGGPIFNSRGQLAGVLFGEGQGRTSGSYCVRVHRFLASIAPETMRDRPTVVATSTSAPAAQNAASPTGSQNRPPLDQVAPPAFASAVAAAQADPFVEPSAALWKPSPTSVRGPIAEPSGILQESDSALNDNAWNDLTGHTPVEQIKSALAAVGVLALLLQGVRWLKMA